MEIVAYSFRLRYHDDSKSSEVPVFLALVGVVVFRESRELPDDLRLLVARSSDDALFLNFEEKGKCANERRDRKERVGMYSALEVGLLPVELQILPLAESFERDVKETDFEFVLKRSDRVFVKRLAAELSYALVR